MSLPTLGFYAEPQILYLHQILEEVRRGQLTIPRFQRPYVWEVRQRIELLNSVIEGLPIGALLIWRTHRDDLSIHNNLAGLPLPAAVVAPGGLRQFLLDGLQRVASLYGALLPLGAEVSANIAKNFRVYYDLSAGRLVPGLELAQPDAHHLPLEIIFDSVALLRFQRGLTSAAAEGWITQIDLLAQAFRTYKIPVVPIVTDDLEVATRSFQRLNQGSTPMSQLHLLHAIAYPLGLDILDTVRSLSLMGRGLRLNRKFDEPIYQALAIAAVDLGDEPAPDALARWLVANKEPLTTAVFGVYRALDLLVTLLGIADLDLPDVECFTVLAAALGRGKRIQPELVCAWFWLVTLGEVFAAGLPIRELRRHTQHLKRLLDTGQNLELAQEIAQRTLPARLAPNSARGRALRLLLAEQGPVDVFDSRHLGHALARVHPVSLTDQGEVSRGADWCLCRPDEIVKLRQQILEHPTPRRLRAHALTAEMVEVWRQGDLNRVLELRQSYLEDLERKRFDWARQGLLGQVVAWSPQHTLWPVEQLGPQLGLAFRPKLLKKAYIEQLRSLAQQEPEVYRVDLLRMLLAELARPSRMFGDDGLSAEVDTVAKTFRFPPAEGELFEFIFALGSYLLAMAPNPWHREYIDFISARLRAEPDLHNRYGEEWGIFLAQLTQTPSFEALWSDKPEAERQQVQSEAMNVAGSWLEQLPTSAADGAFNLCRLWVQQLAWLEGPAREIKARHVLGELGRRMDSSDGGWWFQQEARGAAILALLETDPAAANQEALLLARMPLLGQDVHRSHAVFCSDFFYSSFNYESIDAAFWLRRALSLYPEAIFLRLWQLQLFAEEGQDITAEVEQSLSNRPNQTVGRDWDVLLLLILADRLPTLRERLIAWAVELTRSLQLSADTFDGVELSEDVLQAYRAQVAAEPGVG